MHSSSRPSLALNADSSADPTSAHNAAPDPATVQTSPHNSDSSIGHSSADNAAPKPLTAHTSPHNAAPEPLTEHTSPRNADSSADYNSADIAAPGLLAGRMSPENAAPYPTSARNSALDPATVQTSPHNADSSTGHSSARHGADRSSPLGTPAMRTIVYDGSFNGWLSAVFDIYEYKFREVMILPEGKAQHSLFADTHVVRTDEIKAARVWKGIRQRISPRTTHLIVRTFLSEETGMEDKLLQYARYVLSRNTIVENDLSHPAVLYVTDTARKVYREKHRMEAFVRFQRTKDELYYAVISPDFNVLPLIKDHFEQRYADQRWMIFDTRRKYGLYYDLHTATPVEMNFEEGLGSGDNVSAVLDEKEELYVQLWQQYFTSVNIAARKNIKLHIRHMPLRYWKYLPEKQFVGGART